MQILETKKQNSKKNKIVFFCRVLVFNTFQKSKSNVKKENNKNWKKYYGYMNNRWLDDDVFVFVLNASSTST